MGCSSVDEQQVAETLGVLTSVPILKVGFPNAQQFRKPKLKKGGSQGKMSSKGERDSRT